MPHMLLIVYAFESCKPLGRVAAIESLIMLGKVVSVEEEPIPMLIILVLSFVRILAQKCFVLLFFFLLHQMLHEDLQHIISIISSIGIIDVVVKKKKEKKNKQYQYQCW